MLYLPFSMHVPLIQSSFPRQSGTELHTEIRKLKICSTLFFGAIFLMRVLDTNLTFLIVDINAKSLIWVE